MERLGGAVGGHAGRQAVGSVEKGRREESIRSYS